VLLRLRRLARTWLAAAAHPLVGVVVLHARACRGREGPQVPDLVRRAGEHRWWAAVWIPVGGAWPWLHDDGCVRIQSVAAATTLSVRVRSGSWRTALAAAAAWIQADPPAAARIRADNHAPDLLYCSRQRWGGEPVHGEGTYMREKLPVATNGAAG
jgi:hypothetical protein